MDEKWKKLIEMQEEGERVRGSGKRMDVEDRENERKSNLRRSENGHLLLIL